MLLFFNETFPRKLTVIYFSHCKFPHHLQTELVFSLSQLLMQLLGSQSLLLLGLHLDPNELQTAIKWWLGLDTFGGSMCLLCPDTALDTLGHHAVTCRRGGDVVTCQTVCVTLL